MPHARQRLGRVAEDLAVRRLGEDGYRVVERNARTPLGELDIVALDGDALVFVEVKAGRAGNSFGPERPVLAVGREKQARLRRLAREWLAVRGGLGGVRVLRFDVVGVLFDRGGRVTDFEHVRDAF
jgi:putative endonuclease